MINNLGCEVNKVIDTTIVEIENNYNINVLFGSIIGSKSMGLDNAASDLDFCLIFEYKEKYKILDNNIENDLSINWLFPPDIEVITKKVEDDNKNELTYKIGFLCYEISNVLNSVKEYTNSNRKFPSYFNNNGLSNDDGQFLIFRILSSEYLWDNNYIRTNYESLLNTFIKINILDYYFTRAKGNFDNHLQGKKVKVRKYLYTLHEIYCIKWILDYNTVPPMNFYQLKKMYTYYGITEKIEELLRINQGHILFCNKTSQTLNKDILMVDRDTCINIYIENEINRIADKINKLVTDSQSKQLIALNINSTLYNYLK